MMPTKFQADVKTGADKCAVRTTELTSNAGCLIFHFTVPRARSPFRVLVTSRLTVVRLEETANIQTIHANLVRVIERKNGKVYQLAEVDSYRKRQPCHQHLNCFLP